MDVILASASPRRKELLGGIVKNFIVLPSNADENVSCLNPLETAKQLSFIKAKSVFEQNQNCLVIGADTIVVHDDKILGKPKDKQNAYQMLSQLSGKTHSVITGVTVMTKEVTITFAEVSMVGFKKLCDKDIFDYIATGSPFDKAGGYGIQDSGFVCDISGSYDNVVGLPTEKLAQVLSQFMEEING